MVRRLRPPSTSTDIATIPLHGYSEVVYAFDQCALRARRDGQFWNPLLDNDLHDVEAGDIGFLWLIRLVLPSIAQRQYAIKSPF